MTREQLLAAIDSLEDARDPGVQNPSGFHVSCHWLNPGDVPTVALTWVAGSMPGFAKSVELSGLRMSPREAYEVARLLKQMVLRCDLEELEKLEKLEKGDMA